MRRIWQPHISSDPALRAAFGASGPPAATGSGNASLMLAAVELITDRVSAAVVRAITSGSSSGAAVGQVTAGAAAQAGGVAMAGGAAGGDVGGQTGAASSSQQQGAVRIGFPNLSSHQTLRELAQWYYISELGDSGKTPQQLEAEPDKQWRGGARGPRFQRWAEYDQLLKAIEKQRDVLTEQARKSSAHPQRVLQVDAVTAASALDEERIALGLSVCEYREFVLGKGKGYRKGCANRQPAEGAAEAGADEDES